MAGSAGRYRSVEIDANPSKVLSTIGTRRPASVVVTAVMICSV